VQFIGNDSEVFRMRGKLN